MARRTITLASVAFALLATLAPTRAVDAVSPDKVDDEPCTKPTRVQAAAPFGTTSCPGIRPGGLVEVKATESFCTLGFLYYDSKGQWYITTGGHCAIGNRMAKVWAPGTGPIAYDAAGKPFGRFVYARNDNTDTTSGTYDIGVILISKGITPKAQVCHFGGPTGTSTARSGDPVQLNLYGNADGLSLVVPARSAVATSMPDTTEVMAIGPAFFGDSGAPVLSSSSGGAIGYVFAVGAAYDLRDLGAPQAGHFFIKRQAPQMAAAQAALKTKLVLRTAPRL